MPNGTKPQYQPWNEEEFQADFSVRGMTSIQRWMYRTLLQQTFFISTRPYLPDDESVLWVLAGCENKQQWVENSPEILKNFLKKKVQGKKYLVNKRVVLDYEKWEEKHEKAVKSGKIGGTIAGQGRLKGALSNPQASKVKEREVKISKVKQTEFDTKEDEMGLKAILRKEAAKTLQYTGQISVGTSAMINLLEQAFGVEAVANDFREWTSSWTPGELTYPIDEYTKIAQQRLSVGKYNVPETEIYNVLDEIVHLAEGKVTFRVNQKPALAKLISDFSSKEVVDAFKRFWESVQDEFQLKFAAKNFLETADQLIRENRRTMQEQQKYEQKIAVLRAESKAKIDAELAELEKPEAEDNFFNA